MHDIDDAARWDRFYSGDGDEAARWSGQPNPTLVTEASSLAPGRALDVGCGEGGDAIWLARHGWHVTAIDPSQIALSRARDGARAAGVEVTWLGLGLLELPASTRAYDLVSAHYPVLPRTDDEAAITALLGAVAPGGTLLFVHHEPGPHHGAEHDLDPATHLLPDTLAAHLDDRWHVQLLEAREHRRDRIPDERSPRDLVLRARRRPGP